MTFSIKNFVYPAPVKIEIGCLYKVVATRANGAGYGYFHRREGEPRTNSLKSRFMEDGAIILIIHAHQNYSVLTSLDFVECIVVHEGILKKCTLWPHCSRLEKLC